MNQPKLNPAFKGQCDHGHGSSLLGSIHLERLKKPKPTPCCTIRTLAYPGLEVFKKCLGIQVLELRVCETCFNKFYLIRIIRNILLSPSIAVASTSLGQPCRTSHTGRPCHNKLTGAKTTNAKIHGFRRVETFERLQIYQ